MKHLLGLSIICLALCGCGGTASVSQAPAQVTRFQWGQPVDFEGWTFDFQNARYTGLFTNWLNQPTYGTNFLIVDVVITNRTGQPQPAHFQPIFRLVDSSGALYEPSELHTAMINMQKSGHSQTGQSVNPNISLRKEIVFEAPRGAYQMHVITPNRARAGFGGTITSRGPYFYMDLAPLRR